MTIEDPPGFAMIHFILQSCNPDPGPLVAYDVMDWPEGVYACLTRQAKKSAAF